ncbi:MAG TPA: universal stress protein [Chitinophagales bacterium]|nr:universal stress protein [Chitinophagales bacterium]
MSATLKPKKQGKELPVVKKDTRPRRKALKKTPSFRISKVLFPTDFSESSADMLRMVVNFCEKLQADLVVFHAYKIALVDEYMPSAMVDSMLDEGEKAALEKLHELTSGLETSVQIDYQVKMGFTAESISEAANTSGADLIIMGTNGCNSLEDRMFGTVSWNTIKHAEVPVLTIPEGAAVPAFQNIIFPFECTDKDLEIIQFAVEIASLFDSKIHLIHFLLEGSVVNKTILDKINHRYHKEIREEKLQIQILADKNITDGIVKYAEGVSADMIIMVTHHRGLMATLFHMSTTRNIVLYSSVPLLAFKAE